MLARWLRRVPAKPLRPHELPPSSSGPLVAFLRPAPDEDDGHRATRSSRIIRRGVIRFCPRPNSSSRSSWTDPSPPHRPLYYREKMLTAIDKAILSGERSRTLSHMCLQATSLPCNLLGSTPARAIGTLNNLGHARGHFPHILAASSNRSTAPSPNASNAILRGGLAGLGGGGDERRGCRREKEVGGSV